MKDHKGSFKGPLGGSWFMTPLKVNPSTPACNVPERYRAQVVRHALRAPASADWEFQTVVIIC